ncbi:hypothetical protein C8J57DRAFT_1310683 [Mycena rebaudengoi]|nr:hypothetical protein C8J57DRAFT_1310683 [Mycena rebaudengoi]
MPMTVDELMMEVLLYVRKDPVGGASSLSSAAARAGSKKRSTVEMEADSSSDDDTTEAHSSSDEDEARSSKRLKFSVATPTRTTGIPSAPSIATRSRDRKSAKAKKPPSRQGTPERTVRSAPTTTVPAVAVAVSAGIPPPPAKPLEAPVTSTPSPQASPSKKRSVAEIDSEPLVDGPQPKRVKLACSPAVRRQPARTAKATKSSSIRVY